MVLVKVCVRFVLRDSDGRHSTAVTRREYTRYFAEIPLGDDELSMGVDVPVLGVVQDRVLHAVSPTAEGPQVAASVYVDQDWVVASKRDEVRGNSLPTELYERITALGLD